MFVLVCGFGMFCVTCERHKPRHDEIEIVINDTHSKIWKCPECPFGHEPNVKRGASVNSSVLIQCVECVEGHTFSDSHGYTPGRKGTMQSTPTTVTNPSSSTALQVNLKCFQGRNQIFYHELSVLIN